MNSDYVEWHQNWDLSNFLMAFQLTTGHGFRNKIHNSMIFDTLKQLFKRMYRDNPQVGAFLSQAYLWASYNELSVCMEQTDNNRRCKTILWQELSSKN